jgi:hypothetical protein
MSKKFHPAKVGQVVVEQLAKIARDPGANWGDHNGAYAVQRTLVASMMEREESVPVMFDSFNALQNWVCANGLQFRQLQNFSYTDVIEVISTSASPLLYRAGPSYLWVRAAWRQVYRDAFLAWLDLNYRQSDQRSLHLSTITAYTDAIDNLNRGIIRPRLSSAERNDMVAFLNAECSKHQQAYDVNLVDKTLFRFMDMGIDADHVINKSSLANNPNAWVMLFPVPADINRRFRASVEAGLGKGNSNLSAIALQERPIVLFKIFGNFMPKNDDELRVALRRIRSQIGPDGELDTILDKMEMDIAKYLRTSGKH